MLFVAFDVSDFKHSFINHSKELAKTTITSVVLTKDTAIFLSKECEFRFNHGTPSQKIKTL